MSIVPEYILQQALIKGIRTLREDESLIKMLFRNLEQRDIDTVLAFFKDSPIDIGINYPNKDVTLPAIAIILKSESESHAFLNDLQQSSEHFSLLGQQPFPKAGLLGDQTTVGSGSFSTTGYAGKLLLDPTTAIGGTASTIVAAEGTTLLLDPFEENTIYVVIMEGTGAGQRREVSNIEPSYTGAGVSITVTTDWVTIPDATSIFKLVGVPDADGETGEPSRLYDTDNKLRRYGSIYKATYQLDIIGSDPESTIYLYTIVKALFVISRTFMIKQGLMNMVMRGMDLAPIMELLPQIAFRRGLVLEFEHAFDVFTEIAEPLATSIQVALGVHHPDVSDIDDVERVVSDTTITF